MSVLHLFTLHRHQYWKKQLLPNSERTEPGCRRVAHGKDKGGIVCRSGAVGGGGDAGKPRHLTHSRPSHVAARLVFWSRLTWVQIPQFYH